MDLDAPTWPQKCFIWKIGLFEEHQRGIGPIGFKSEEIGQKWILEPLFSWILANFQVWITYEHKSAWPSGYSVKV